MALQRRARRYDREAEVRADETAVLALPKRSVEGEGIDYSILTHPKAVLDRERGFLDLVRGELCAVNADHHHECGGVTEAAHIEVHGMGIKASDFLTAPLCTIHHRIQHDIGIVQFQIVYGVNLWRVNALLLIRWIRRIS
jgi:hypothetical protein